MDGLNCDPMSFDKECELTNAHFHKIRSMKLKIDKKEADPKGSIHQFSVSVRTLTVLAHILIDHILIV